MTMTWSDALAAEREKEEVMEENAIFIRELEKRSMSTWSDEELAQYSRLTGQDETEPEKWYDEQRSQNADKWSREGY